MLVAILKKDNKRMINTTNRKNIFIIFITVGLLLDGCRFINSSSKLQFDGLYFFKKESIPKYYDCFRFYRDGTILNGAFEKQPEEIWETFNKKYNFSYETSKYKIRNNKVTFSFKDRITGKAIHYFGRLYGDKINFEVKYSDDNEKDIVFEKELTVEFKKMKNSY